MSDLDIQDVPSIDLEIEPVNDIDLEFSDVKVIGFEYKGAGTDNIELTVNNDEKTISATLKQVQYDSKEQFPDIGSDRLIYVDLSDNSLWFYKNGEYVSASADLSDLLDTKVSQVEYSKDQTFPDGSDGGVIGRLYMRFRNNTENSIVANCQNVKYTVPVRDSYGNFYIGTPGQIYHAANKKYVDDKFNGASKPYTYDTYPEMITKLNAMSATDINRGQDIMVVQTGIPDVWVAYVEETSVPYTYVDDETFINELLTNGTVQVGYYKLGYLETQKIDLTEYVKIEQLNEKQDKLIAGENITIDENNVISATGGGGGLNIGDLPQFVNKIYIRLSNAPSIAGAFTLPIVESNNIVVNWGDGTSTAYTEPTTVISHDYSDPNFEGWVNIYGDCKGINFKRQDGHKTRTTLIRVIYDRNITELGSYSLDDCSKIEELVLPETVTKLGIYCVYNCGSLVELKLPNSITEIPNYAFNQCYNLTRLELPTKLETIGDRAFQSNNKLQEITIPTGVTHIGSATFTNTNTSYLPNGRVVHCNRLIPPYSSSGVNGFGGTTITTVFVPTQALKAYKTATNWTTHAYRIYPEGGNYSETITIPSAAWDTATNTVTVEAVGSTTEDRNIITWNVSSGGVQVENTYGLKCTAQGTMSLTFSCETIPTEDVEVSVRYMLTNY